MATTFETLVDISHTLLCANGRWCVLGSDETLRRDITATVNDVARLLRHECNVESLVTMAIAELERRAESAAVTG